MDDQLTPIEKIKATFPFLEWTVFAPKAQKRHYLQSTFISPCGCWLIYMEIIYVESLLPIYAVSMRFRHNENMFSTRDYSFASQDPDAFLSRVNNWLRESIKPRADVAKVEIS
jgi:hypothetical protein